MESSTTPQSGAEEASMKPPENGAGGDDDDGGRMSRRAETIAELAATSAGRFADAVAVRYKHDGAWDDVTYAELAAIVHELARGLIGLGIDRGDRVCILSNTRPEWSYADLAIATAGAIAVPIYQTNSPGECEWVIRDSGARAIFCEDDVQLAKVTAIAGSLPDLETAIVFEHPTVRGSEPESGGSEPESGGSEPGRSGIATLALTQLRERGANVPEEQLVARREAVEPGDTFTIIYTSGTTGPPKGCVLTHGNYRAILDMVEDRGVLEEASGDVVYLYLPLAHSFALLLQLATFDLGVTLAYFGGDTKQIVAELSEVQPTYLPSVPRIFEKIYTLVSSNVDRELLDKSTAVGIAVRERQRRGEPIPDELAQPFAHAEEQLFKNVRAAFGGRLREAVTGAAPISKEILEFFYACGVPVMEGYGMTETATAASSSRPGEHRFGSVGKPLPGVEVRIAEDGEVLIKGPNIFAGYYGRQDSDFGTVLDGWLHTGDLGRLDEDGFLYIVGRKKDIIITAGGKNLTPANMENDMKQCRWVSQAVMHGDRRPYPVLLITLDEEEIVPWAQAQGLPAEIGGLAHEPAVTALIQAELDRVNERYAQVERVKRFAILDHDLSQETGELTPTLKVKRAVVEQKYADVLDALYAP
ncbi:MAG: AMP-dependent synthetase/ligase [Solirubrobacteraceae bacterium]